jgi:hypothetical protein
LRDHVGPVCPFPLYWPSAGASWARCRLWAPSRATSVPARTVNGAPDCSWWMAVKD